MSAHLIGTRHEHHCPDCETGRHCLAGNRCEDCGGPMRPGPIPYDGYQASRAASWPRATHYMAGAVQAIIGGH